MSTCDDLLAIELFKENLDLDPSHRAYRIALGRVLLPAGNYRASIEAMEQAARHSGRGDAWE
jgi:predicted Zn-dependent protease